MPKPEEETFDLKEKVLDLYHWFEDRYYEFPTWARVVALVSVGYAIHCIIHYVL